MLRATVFLALLMPMFASAQPIPGHHPGGMPMAGMHAPAAAMPTHTGQSAFAAIQEIVQILDADPATDWSKVNIEALRQHLIDMDNVTLHAEVKTEAAEGGIVFIVSGTSPVRDSIQRMVTAHAATMNGHNGWQFAAAATETGATLAVRTSGQDIAKIRALGFIGVLTLGMHHQEHHLMIARGEDLHH